MTSLPELASVVGDRLKSSPADNVRAAADRDVDERTRRLRTVIAITPMTMTAAAPIAMIADMLRMILLWRGFGATELVVESEEEFGLRTIGLGRTAGQDLLTAEPQSDGLPNTEEGDMVLKKPPAGSSPCRWLCEMLNDDRWTRFTNCFGKPPVRVLKDKSTFCRFVSFAIAIGIGPVRLFFDSILQNPTKKRNKEQEKRRMLIEQNIIAASLTKNARTYDSDH